MGGAFGEQHRHGNLGPGSSGRTRQLKIFRVSSSEEQEHCVRSALNTGVVFLF